MYIWSSIGTTRANQKHLGTGYDVSRGPLCAIEHAENAEHAIEIIDQIGNDSSSLAAAIEFTQTIRLPIDPPMRDDVQEASQPNARLMISGCSG
ncbi:hypothetical protein I6F26_30005 [Ensifer sp. IC3342]|nr:hypothetical protein [Ensifer sp. BRP08]MCA1450760.1 hypothetical protein [Ensifer sp. IC3342]